MSVKTDPVLTGLALDLLACLQAAADDTANPPANFSLRPGTQIEMLMSTIRDECCEGLAWVRPITGYPSSTPHEPDIEPSRCGPIQYAAQLEMGIARCAPTPAAHDLVSNQSWTDLTIAILDDYAAMRRAVCCFTEVHTDMLVSVGSWEPLPVEGACYGGFQVITVPVPACDCD